MQGSASRMRATVVDHDADIADLICELLEPQGIECTVYTRALPGIDALTASRPDVILVDMALRAEREQLTGLQVVHSARSGTALRDVPIIVLVTEPAALGVTWPDLMDRGDIHRLQKPFDLFSFDRVLNTALGMREGGSAIARAAGLHAVSDARVSDHNNENPRDDMDDARELLNLRAIEVSTCAALSQTSSTAAADDVTATGPDTARTGPPPNG